MRIGITMSTSKTQYYINQAYVDYLVEAKFSPVLITGNMDVKEAISNIDGLLLPGGIDIDPIFYGEDNDTSYSVDPKKDEFERALLHTARIAGLPIFGICRGFQLIVREFMLHHEESFGYGIFDQHISYHNQVDAQSLDRTIFQHFVDADGRMLYSDKDAGKMRIPVNSMHHQCFIVDLKTDVPKLAAMKLQVVAWTERGLKQTKNSKNVVCEALRIVGWGGPILAVQWHPEELRDVKLIQNFFEGYKAVQEKTQGAKRNGVQSIGA